MQPCTSREMQAILNQSQMSPTLQDFQSGQHHHHHNQITNPTQTNQQFDPTSSHDDFLDQMLSTLPSCSWTDLAGPNPKFPWDILPNALPGTTGSHKLASPDDPEFHFDHDQSEVLASKLRQYQISSGGGANSTAAGKSLLLQQQLLLQSRGGGDSGFASILGGGDDVIDGSCFKSPNLGEDVSIQALYNGFVGSLHGSSNQSQHFHNPQDFQGSAPVMNQVPATSGSAGGGVAQPRQRVRARRGQATDPHSIAERLRRERIAERMKALQELVPNANKSDKASMLDEIIDYVKFLQLQVKVLSMSRLGSAAAVAPLVTDMSSEGGGDCIQTSMGGRGVNGTQTASTSNANNSNNDSLTVTEHQVAKLMEEDMGSAMQYLQGKGLCLMPISLATAISTATCHPARNPMTAAPTSSSMSVLTVQSATMGNGGGDRSVKDSTSVSKP